MVRIGFSFSSRAEESINRRDTGVAKRLAGGALAHYQKKNCLVVIDRDGEHYDLMLTNPEYEPDAADIAAGEELFGHLRMQTVDISRL